MHVRAKSSVGVTCAPLLTFTGKWIAESFKLFPITLKNEVLGLYSYKKVLSVATDLPT